MVVEGKDQKEGSLPTLACLDTCESISMSSATPRICPTVTEGVSVESTSGTKRSTLFEKKS